MDEVLDRVRAARERLESKDRVRDGMLNAKRGVTSSAREAINLVQQDETEEALDAYNEALDQVSTIREEIDGHAELWQSGALRNSLQEVCEAWALLQLSGEDVELPDEQATPEALVLGTADAIGELRRQALDALIEQDPDRARERLDTMEALYEELRTIDVPSGVVDLKHKVDVGRTLVDKTRGKIAIGRIEQRLSNLDATRAGSRTTTDQETE